MWTGRLLAALLQALQLSYAIGTILGPLLIRPHLHGYMNATQVKTMNVTVYQEVIDQRRASLAGPFIIIGAILGLGKCFLNALSFSQIDSFLLYSWHSSVNSLSECLFSVSQSI